MWQKEQQIAENRFSNDPEERENACFGACVQEPSCGGKCSRWTLRKHSDALILSFSVLAFVALLLGVIAPIAMDGLIQDGIYTSLVVDSKDAPGYKAWQTNARKDGQEAYYGVYYFDLQNPQATINGEKPRVIERGPYMYREFLYKFNIEWHDGGEKVSFFVWRYFVFDPENSAVGVQESDNITQVYFSAVTLQSVMIRLEPALHTAVDMIVDEYLEKKEEGANPIEKERLEREKEKIEEVLAEEDLAGIITKLFLCESPYGVTPFQTRSAYDFYWGWFNDPIMSMLKPLMAKVGNNLTAAVPGIGMNLSSIDDTLRRSNRDVLYTGKNDLKKLNRYILNKNTSLIWTCLFPKGGSDEEQIWPTCPPFQTDWTDEQARDAGYVLPWATDYANRVEGTDATQFGPIVRSDLLEAFISDVYLSGFVQHTGFNEDFHGIKLRRYELRNSDLENATINPNNYQYYQFGPMGVLNLTNAVGAPVFASKPHFLDGDPRLQAAVIGLSARREIHDTYADLEENTGVSMRVRKRLQVSNYMYDYEVPTLSVASAMVLSEIFMQIICGDTPNCTDAKEMTKCMHTPYTWHVYDGAVYLPYAWTDEYYDLRSEDALAIKRDVIDNQSLAQEAQVWCFVVGVVFAVLALTVLVSRRLFQHEPQTQDEATADTKVDYTLLSG